MNWDSFVQYLLLYFLGIRSASPNLNYALTNWTFAIAIVLVFNHKPYDRKGILLKIADLLVTQIVMFLISYFVSLGFNTATVFYVCIPLTIAAHAFLMNHFSLQNRLLKAMTLASLLLIVFRFSLDIGFILSLGDNDYYVVFAFTAVSVFIVMFFSARTYHRIVVPCFIGQGLVTISVYVTIIYLTNTIHDPSFSIYSLVVMGCFFLITCITYFLAYEVTFFYDKAIANQALYLKSQNDYQMVQLAQENIEDLRKMRHDMKNQYEYMKMLLNQKDYAKLEAYFSDMSESAFVPLNYIDCGNSDISAVMNMEVHKAKNEGIAISHSLLVPAQLDISSFDLSRFLSNIVDNAIESVKRDNLENATVAVEIFYREPYLVFNIQNPVSNALPPDKRLTISTSKNDPLVHGYGKKIIDEIAHSYYGQVKYEVKDSKFVVTAMLKNAPRAKEEA